MSEAVYQIRYRWSPSSLLGTRGMGPVESTLPDDLLPGWDQLLRDHVWAAGAEPGFTFLVHNGAGALLRKIATPASDGRPGSAAHVLLSQQLTAPAALGLTSWDGWNAPDLGQLPWSALEPAAQHGLSELRGRARAVLTEQLTGLFAELLRAPGDAYTVIGEPDPLAVTCALGDLIGQIPTFASDESDDTGPTLPTAVFLREVPFSSTTVTRRRLNPAAPDADPGLLSFAAAAVDAYASDGLDGIAPIRRDRPPSDLKEVRAWVQGVQFTPGVIADLARLPKLSQAVLDGLVARETLGRIKTAAARASSRDLMQALDRRLPDEVVEVVVREAVIRVCSTTVDRLLLDHLAQFGPLPLDMVARQQPTGFDHLATVTRALLAPADRRVLLEQCAQGIPLGSLIRWIDEHAAVDAGAALAAYAALCSRAHKASEDDIRVLVARSALAEAARRMAESDAQASLYLVTLLRALPKRARSAVVVAELAARADPVLLHALDTLATDQPVREVVHRQIRLAFYQAHHLHEPSSPLTEDSSADPRASRRQGRFARRGRPSHHRKPT